MSTIHTSESGDVRDVKNTCNVLHVARSAQFDAANVLTTLMQAQQLLASGVTLPAALATVYGSQGAATWLGGESSDVIACAWAKDVDGVVGTMSIQIKSDLDYLSTIRAGDLLLVMMSDSGNYDPSNRFDGTLVSIVIVDRVSLIRRVQGGATTESVAVNARDLAVVFAESATVFDPTFAQIENASFTGDFIKQLFGDKAQIALSPTENVLLLLLLLYDATQTGSNMMRAQWKLTASPDDAAQLVSLIDVTSWVQFPTPFYSIAKPPAIIQAGNVWSLLEGFANTTVNEFFYDIRDSSAQERQFLAWQSQDAESVYFSGNQSDLVTQYAFGSKVATSGLFKTNNPTSGPHDVSAQPSGSSVPALVLRQRPYGSEAFSRLPVTVVDSREVEELELSCSSHDAFNWFRVRFPDISPLLQEAVRGIRIVPTSIAKFGFRRMDAETRYIFTSSDASVTFSNGSQKTDFGDVFDAYVKLLSSWFKQNEYWLAGLLTMRFKPSIRCGTRLQLVRGGKTFDFYVQGVQQNFSKDPGASRTTLTLTRGRCTSTPDVPDVETFDFQHDGFAPSGDTE